MLLFKKIFFISILAVILFAPTFVLADKYGLDAAAGTAGLPSNNGQTLPGLVGSIIGVGLSLIGIIFFLLILYAGFLWMSAMGKTENVQKAKDTLEAAAIGLVIVLAAYAITKFVFGGLGVGGGDGGAAPAGGNGGEAVLPVDANVSFACIYKCNVGAPCRDLNMAQAQDPVVIQQIKTDGHCTGEEPQPCALIPECSGL